MSFYIDRATKKVDSDAIYSALKCDESPLELLGFLVDWKDNARELNNSVNKNDGKCFFYHVVDGILSKEYDVCVLEGFAHIFGLTPPSEEENSLNMLLMELSAYTHDEALMQRVLAKIKLSNEEYGFERRILCAAHWEGMEKDGNHTYLAFVKDYLREKYGKSIQDCFRSIDIALKFNQEITLDLGYIKFFYTHRTPNNDLLDILSVHSLFSEYVEKYRDMLLKPTPGESYDKDKLGEILTELQALFFYEFTTLNKPESWVFFRSLFSEDQLLKWGLESQISDFFEDVNVHYKLNSQSWVSSSKALALMCEWHDSAIKVCLSLLRIPLLKVAIEGVLRRQDRLSSISPLVSIFNNLVTRFSDWTKDESLDTAQLVSDLVALVAPVLGDDSSSTACAAAGCTTEQSPLEHLKDVAQALKEKRDAMDSTGSLCSKAGIFGVGNEVDDKAKLQEMAESCGYF